MPFVGETKDVAGAQVAIAARIANKMPDSTEQNGFMTIDVQQIQELLVMRYLLLHVGHLAKATACASWTSGAAAELNSGLPFTIPAVAHTTRRMSQTHKNNLGAK